MNEKQEKLSELQEILFWQQLNKQLILTKKGGVAISDAHQKFIQKFCFDNRLFSKVTEAPLMDEIQMSLITDFSDLCFFTVKVDSWTDWLRQLLPKVVVLDIEDALSDAFDALGQYDKHYHLTKNEHEDENEALFAVIGQFLDLKEDLGQNFPGMVAEAYESKYSAMVEITNMIDGDELWQISKTDSSFSLDYLGSAEDESFHSINNVYYDQFCSPSRKMAFHSRRFKSELRNALYRRRDIKDSKIREFIDNETTLLSQELITENKFWAKLLRRGKKSNRMEICNFRPFEFLENPFPVI